MRLPRSLRETARNDESGDLEMGRHAGLPLRCDRKVWSFIAM
ncbi:MAG: hypothetical protein ACTSXL_06010 [Alphaproteobacteria bacterium]